MPTYIVLLGPPGVGKGTQARIVARSMGLPHVSSGDLFRENIKKSTPLGEQARRYIDNGELVPDDVTIAMVEERLSRPDCKTGAILDGFPRTPVQAKALGTMLRKFGGDVNVVQYITAPQSVLVERATGRLTCRAHGHIYHERFKPPLRPGLCDIDGSDLYQREDDRAETVTRRVKVYLEQTAPLVEYYRRQGKLVEIDGTRPIEIVTDALIAAVRK